LKLRESKAESERILTSRSKLLQTFYNCLLLILTCFSCLVTPKSALAQSDTLLNIVQWSSSDGGNDHWYAIVSLEIPWVDHRDLAGSFEQDGHVGYLATINFQAENDFVMSVVENHTDQPNVADEFFLGGFRIGSNWQWLTDEPMSYTNWSPGEPSGDGIALAIWGASQGGRAGNWNDVPENIRGGTILRLWSIIEFGSVDSDSDGVVDFVDNCPLISNPDQLDLDGDNIGDVCDNCTDADGDGLGDPGFAANTCPEDSCPVDPLNDIDADGLCDSDDNCPNVSNTDQLDQDGDGIGDLCDNCPSVSNQGQEDNEGDGFGDVCDDDDDNDGLSDDIDNCQFDFNPDQKNTSGVGLGDACCCIGGVGNIDYEGGVDLADLSLLIDHLFINLPILECPAEADIDRSGGIDIADLTALIDHMFITVGPPLPPCPQYLW